MIAVTGATGTSDANSSGCLWSVATARASSLGTWVSRNSSSAPMSTSRRQISTGRRPSRLPSRESTGCSCSVPPPPDRSAGRCNLVTAAAAAGVRHVVKTSVFRASRVSNLRLANQHGQIEEMITRSGLEWTFLRPTFFMQNLAGQILNGVVCSAAEDGRVAMIDARDVAAAAVTVLDHARRHSAGTYTLTGPRAVTFDQVSEVVSAAGGSGCPHRRVTPEGVRAAMLQSGAEHWFAARHRPVAHDAGRRLRGHRHRRPGSTHRRRGRDVTRSSRRCSRPSCSASVEAGSACRRGGCRPAVRRRRAARGCRPARRSAAAGSAPGWRCGPCTSRRPAASGRPG